MPRNAARKLINNKRECLPVVIKLRAKTTTTAAGTNSSTQGATDAIEIVELKSPQTSPPLPLPLQHDKRATTTPNTSSTASSNSTGYEIFEIVELDESRPSSTILAEEIIVIDEDDEAPDEARLSSQSALTATTKIPSTTTTTTTATTTTAAPTNSSNSLSTARLSKGGPPDHHKVAPPIDLDDSDEATAASVQQQRPPASLYPLVTLLLDQQVPPAEASPSPVRAKKKGQQQQSSRGDPSPTRLASLRVRRPAVVPVVAVAVTPPTPSARRAASPGDPKRGANASKASPASVGRQKQAQPRTPPEQNQGVGSGLGPGSKEKRRIDKYQPHLDVEFLNKIDVLDWEVKKGGSKRKRTHSFAVSSATALSLRRRSSTRKSSASSSGHLSGGSESRKETSNVASPADGVAEIAAPGIAADATETLQALNSNTNNSNTNTNTSNTTTTSGGSNSNSKKRPRVMSLYERHYMNDDGGGGRSATASNGYLSATARAGGGLLHGNDAGGPDAGQELGNQYYLASSGGAGGPAGAGALAASNASSMSSAGLGSSSGGSLNAINHAPSMATLCNIGNTCYLNSVVYTLRFAPQFLHNLHHLVVDLNAVQQNMARYRTSSSSATTAITASSGSSKTSSLSRGLSAAVHLDSGSRHWGGKEAPGALGSDPNGGGGSGSSPTQKSSHQLLTERLHDLYQSLHRNEAAESTDPFHADTLLHAIQDVSAIFEGNQQQDAHEFLMCLLNSVRETCQTLIKAIGDCPDLITNGYISHVDELDANSPHERDAPSGGSGGGGGGGGSSSSSLSTSKGSFFLRKSKRKEEAKNSKNLRLQSPLKDSNAGGVPLSQTSLLTQPASNSLFYLNTVDLSGAPSAAAAAPAKLLPFAGGGGDDESANTVLSLKESKERLAERIRELGMDFFSEDFEGVTVSTTKCLSCETVTEQKESMIDIAVPVPIAGYDGADQPDKSGSGSFIQSSCITREYFRAENKYRCEQCTGYTEAIRSISYEVLPRLLVIQLSRFSGGMEKINSYIPTAFTLQCFCAKCCELSEPHKLHVYRLYSVITHVGATMSVGHYIAYTCSLDWANEYVNCPKDRDRRAAQQAHGDGSGGPAAAIAQQQQQLSNGLLGGGSSSSSSAASAAASALAASSSSLIKKMKFGRSKASSSGDMSKHLKTLNGLTSKGITNGIGRLSMNTTCQGMSCCATRLCTVQHQQRQAQCAAASYGGELSEEVLPNGGAANSHGVFPAGYGSTGRNSSRTLYTGSYAGAGAGASAAAMAGTPLGGGGGGEREPIWYMCDDDKIKAMSQREFEELLSPTRKITITPYLLFYSRFDLQPAAAHSKQTPPAPPPHTSWSSESLNNGSSAGSTSAAATAGSASSNKM